MAIQSAVEAEVAEVGRHAVEVTRVVAKDGEGDAFGLFFCVGFCCRCIPLRFGEAENEVGNVEDEFVVAAGVFACEFFADVDSGGLPGAFEVKEGSSVGERIGDGNASAVPAVAPIVRNFGVAAVVGIETVRHGDGLPDRDLFRVPCLPWAAE